MLSEGQKRRASLSVLEKLRGKGMPGRESEVSEDGEFDSMFAVLDEEGKIKGGEKEEPPKKPTEEDDTATPPLPISGSVAKKGPKLESEKTKQFMKAFKGVR